MIRVNLILVRAFFWLPMQLNLRKMKRLTLDVKHHLVRMWAVLFLRVSKVKVKVKYRNHIPLQLNTLILVPSLPLMHEICLVGLASECVFFLPKATSYGLPQAWLNTLRIDSIKDFPTYCIMFEDDLTQDHLNELESCKFQVMKIKVVGLDSLLRKPVKVTLECGIPLSIEESAVASIETIRNL
jgi:hypothetical protein